MNDVDEELQRALELSAQEHAAKTSTDVLDTEFVVRRRDLGLPCSHHWPSQRLAQDGIFWQVDTLNQFGPWVQYLIKEFEAPSSTCGYMAMANAFLLLRFLPPGRSWSQTELEECFQQLRDPATVAPVVRDAMDFVARRRQDWITSHISEFPTETSRKNYMKAWVANYEISDFFRARVETSSSVMFARFNQWPEISQATHEEKERIREDEARFGGRSCGGSATTYGQGDSVFFIERFSPVRLLESPEEFTGVPQEDLPPIVVLDLAGHFAVAVCCSLCEVSGTASDCSALVVVNTTGVMYLDNAMCANVFDLFNAPLEGASVPTCGTYDWDMCSKFADKSVSCKQIHDRRLLELLAMGFAETPARAALERAGSGGVQAALATLLE